MSGFTERGESELIAWAACRGDDREIRRLLKKGYYVDSHCASCGHMPNALHFAALLGRLSTVELLLRRGANVDGRTSKGMTALMLAASRGHNAEIKLLLKYKADASATDNAGLGVLHWAVTGGHSTMCLLRTLTVVSPAESHETCQTSVRVPGDGQVENDPLNERTVTNKLLQLSEYKFDQIVMGALQHCISEDPSSVYCYLQHTEYDGPAIESLKSVELMETMMSIVKRFTLSGFIENLEDIGHGPLAKRFRESYATFIGDIDEAVISNPALEASEIGDRLVSKWRVPGYRPMTLSQHNYPVAKTDVEDDDCERVLPSNQADGCEVWKTYDVGGLRVLSGATPFRISGLPDERLLSKLADNLGFEWTRLAFQLGVRQCHMEQFQLAYPSQPHRWMMAMLMEWRVGVRNMAQENRCDELTAALKSIGRNDLAKLQFES